MAEVNVGTVDVLVVNPDPSGWHVLVLRRSPTTRCPGAWEMVHGRIEDGEAPEEAARRELREETGLVADRLYSLTVHPFYLLKSHVVELAVVFCAFVNRELPVVIGEEHDEFTWLSPEKASRRFFWPRERDALVQARELLGGGDAGAAEDVLRVRD
ncbi:MAG: NUDIX domain-containing protein [Gemmatimonadaceae bacterium]|nr:NUDIX domain-containing protein [Gemmatimonadaceae bacterium]